MAATGKTPILLYGSTTATNAPVAGNLTNSSDGCEIAINVADKNLFFKDSTNVVNTVPIRQSSGSSDGWLSSTDWTTFNNKQAAYTNLTSIGSLANATGWLYNNGSGTFSYSTPTASDVGAVPTTRTISTTAPLAGGGDLSANRTLSITQATTSTNGYLSSTDWNTFNNKQPAGSYALTTGTLAQFASTTSAQLAGVISDETGSGSLVFGTSPTLTTPTISGLLSAGGGLKFTGSATLAATNNQTWSYENPVTRYYIGDGTGYSLSFCTRTGSATTELFRINEFSPATINWNAGSLSSAGMTIGTANVAESLFFNTTSLNSGGTGYFSSGLGIDGTYGTPANRSVVQLHAYGVKSAGGYGADMAFFTSANAAESEKARIFSSGGVSVGDTTDPGAGNLRLGTGNLVIGTSGKGIDFSATAGTGTSELLADYEEGTWTPTQGAGLTVVGSFSSSGTYTKVGRQVTVIGNIAGSTSVATSSGGVMVNGLPYTPATYCEGTAANVAGTSGSILFINSSTSIYSVSVIAATTNIRFAATYFV